MMGAMQGWRIALWIGLVILVFGFLWLVRGVLLPFVLAYLIALLLEPTVKALRRIGIGRAAAVGIITVVFLALSPESRSSRPPMSRLKRVT
jgi:predicted PurR-regulated permease PerM